MNDLNELKINEIVNSPIEEINEDELCPRCAEVLKK